jgi:hypothetical protein
MTRLDCIEYLVDNACHGSEWQESGMFSAVEEVVRAPASAFEDPRDVVEAWLDTLIENARRS